MSTIWVQHQLESANAEDLIQELLDFHESTKVPLSEMSIDLDYEQEYDWVNTKLNVSFERERTTEEEVSYLLRIENQKKYERAKKEAQLEKLKKELGLL